MVDIIGLLKNRARILHRQIQASDRDAFRRISRLAEFRGKDPDTIKAGVQRRHCLKIIARETGFHSWTQVVQGLRGGNGTNFGKLLYPLKCGAHINIWAASYDQAKEIHARHGGYLLAYQTQFLVVDEGYIRTLGLDPDDADWQRIGHDWVNPQDETARSRLYAQLIQNT